MTNKLSFPILPKEIETINGSIIDTICAANTLMVAHPDRPAKPKLLELTAAAARKFAAEYEAWERDMEDYKIAIGLIRDHNSAVESLIEDYIRRESGLTEIPAQYQDNVWKYAWRESHSGGFYEVFMTLCELVGIFE